MKAAHMPVMTFMICAALLAAAWLFGFTGAGAFGALGLFAFLPGLSLLSRTRQPLKLARLLAAFLISVPISTLVFALTRMVGIGVPLTVGAMAVLASVMTLGVGWKYASILRLRRSDRIALAMAASAALLLWVALGPPGIRASWHGFFHAAVVEQILNEGVPPSNPGLCGEPLNFYWAYHVFVALITATSHANPLTVIAAMNALFLALSLLIAFDAARCCRARSGDRLLTMSALVGTINTGAGLVLIAKLLRHGRIPGDAYSDGTWIDWLSQRSIPGRLWDGRASSFIKEYYDISGMAAGMTLFFAYVWLWLGGSRRWGNWFVPLLSATLLTLVSWYPPLALPALAHFGLVVVYFAWKNRRAWKQKLSHLIRMVLIFILCLFPVVPYYYQITDSRGWIKSTDEFLTLQADLRSFLGALTPFWLLAPFIGLVIATGFRRHRSVQVHLVLFSLILFAFAACTNVQQNTQYKYVYVLSLPLALLAIQGVRLVADRIALLRRHPRMMTAILTLFFLQPALIFAVGAAMSLQQSDRSLAINGRHIVDRTNPARMECLAWIHNHTPHDAVLILPLVPHDRSPSNPGFREPAIAQRACFLVYDIFHSKRFRDYESRAAVVQELFERDDFEAASKALRDMKFDRPLFVLKESEASTETPAGWHIEHSNQEWLVLRWNSPTPAGQ